jgi:nitrite reductase (NADH) small subunit
LGRWVRAARASDVPPGGARSVRIEGRWYALFHDRERGVFATDDACPHQGASLSEGTYHEGRVICPMHGWVFDVRTGECHGVPVTSLACYATRPVGEDIEIELPDESGDVDGGPDAGQARA